MIPSLARLLLSSAYSREILKCIVTIETPGVVIGAFSLDKPVVS